MALERRNPLPAGRYWQDFFGDQRQTFTAWRAEHKGAVRIIATTADEDGDKPHEWVLFETSEPLPWDAKAHGFPTKAGPEIKDVDDTVQKPPPETPHVGMLALLVGGGLLSGLLTHLVISKLFK